jgi:hypothetical protein
MGGEWDREFCLNADFHGTFRVLIHAANLRHGTHGFTSLPKEGVLRIFPFLKIRRLRPGLNPRTWVPEANTQTPRPPKPLRWVDNIKMNLKETGGGVDWIYLTQDRNTWRAVVEHNNTWRAVVEHNNEVSGSIKCGELLD